MQTAHEFWRYEVTTKNQRDQNHFWSTNIVHATAGLLVLWPELKSFTSHRKLARKYKIDSETIGEAANGLVRIGLLEERTRRFKGVWAPVRLIRRSPQLDLDVVVQKAVSSEKEGEDS